MSTLISTLVRNRDFTVLWTSQIVSNLGSQLSAIAMLWFMYKITDSEMAMAILMVAMLLPFAILGPLGGVAVDRWNRKHILAFSNLSQGVLMLLVPFFAITITLFANNTPYATLFLAILLIVVNLLNSTALQFFSPARAACIPSLVPPENLSTANALTALVRQLAALIGPALGGFLIAITLITKLFLFESVWMVPSISSLPLEYYLPFFLDGLSFLIAALAIFFLIRKDLSPDRSRADQSTGVIGDLKDGVRVIVNSRVLIFMLLLYFGMMFSAGPITALLIPYLTSIGIVGEGTAEMISGVLLSAASFTGVIGGIVLGSRKKLGRPLSIMLFSVFLVGLSLSLFGLIGLFEAPWIFVLFVMMIFGVIRVTIGIPALTIVQQITYDHLRGKVFSVMYIIVTVGSMAGMMIAGIAAEIFEMWAVFLPFGLLTIIFSILALTILFVFRLDARVAQENKFQETSRASKVEPLVS